LPAVKERGGNVTTAAPSRATEKMRVKELERERGGGTVRAVPTSIGRVTTLPRMNFPKSTFVTN
jgi:hypothetical protein